MTSSVQFYLDWAKERVDEMDAVLASLEGQVAQMAVDARGNANKLTDELRSRRDAFQREMKKHSEASESLWQQKRAEMESNWNAFQSDVRKYFEKFGEQAKQQQAAFEGAAAAQLTAWRQTTDRLQAASKAFAADRRSKVELTLQQMKTAASAAESNFQRLKTAGNESWTSLNAALGESRAAFDRASQAAWDAFRRAER